MSTLTRKQVAPLRPGVPRTHENCKAAHKVFRPGKTAVDKANGVIRTVPNRRIWDDKEKRYVRAW